MPTIGHIVIYGLAQSEPDVNGAREHPAMITRAWNDEMVNLVVFFDGAGPQIRTSVEFEPAAGERDAYWRWPERA